MADEKQDEIVYRKAEEHEIPQIAALLEHHDWGWPGGPATPYVAVRGDQIIGLCFKLLVWHVDMACSAPGEKVSITKFHAAIDADFQQLANEEEIAAVYYTFVQDTPRALAVAAKNGLEPQRGLIVHHKTIEPQGIM